MISTHILDTSKGIPVNGVPVTLQKLNGEKWIEIGKGTTNGDGRHSFECEPAPGAYQLLFDVEVYFSKDAKASFFKTIPVMFKIEDTKRKYHVPLLLSPFGYSTYRGS